MRFLRVLCGGAVGDSEDDCRSIIHHRSLVRSHVNVFMQSPNASLHMIAQEKDRWNEMTAANVARPLRTSSMGHTTEVWGLESAEEMGGIGEKWPKSEEGRDN